MFDHILGHASIKAYLEKALTQNCLPHALLFAGPDGVGKSLIAKALASRLLHIDLQKIETHPDFYTLRPEGKGGVYSIEAIRSMISEVYMAPFKAPAKVFLLYEVERMQIAAANALLKTLEEPAPHATLILLTSDPKQLLPTILSRCARLFFHSLSEGDIASLLIARNYPPHFAKQAHGSARKAIELAKSPSFETPLFSLLAQEQPYHRLLPCLEQLETSLADEDPVRQHHNVERLLSTLLMWCRDQHARRLGLDQNALFFPEALSSSRSLPTLGAMERVLEEARLALSRNMKLSICLERAFAVLF